METILPVLYLYIFPATNGFLAVFVVGMAATTDETPKRILHDFWFVIFSVVWLVSAVITWKALSDFVIENTKVVI